MPRSSMKSVHSGIVMAHEIRSATMPNMVECFAGCREREVQNHCCWIRDGDREHGRSINEG